MSELPTTPLRRAGRDYALGSGDALVNDKIRQLLGTERGELPWRQGFGAGIGGLRHRGNDATTARLAEVRARDALSAWIPEIEVTEVSAEREGTTLRLSIRYRNQGRSAQALVELADPAGVS